MRTHCRVRQLSPHLRNSRFDLNSEIDLWRGDLQNPVWADDIMPRRRGCPVKSRPIHFIAHRVGFKQPCFAAAGLGWRPAIPDPARASAPHPWSSDPSHLLWRTCPTLPGLAGWPTCKVYRTLKGE